jgi:hypothetical protein
MVWRDLDVATRCADPTTEEVLDAMRPVLAHPGVREVTYMPQLGSRSPSGAPADQRWYFVLRYVAADGEVSVQCPVPSGEEGRRVAAGVGAEGVDEVGVQAAAL